MNSKVLSIVIPAYNMEPYLENCLKSISACASLSKLDVMVVDDGGQDRSLDIALSFERSYPESFRAIHKENGGHGSVINYGISNAQGKYFKVLDGDDWVDSSALDALVSKLEIIDADIVASDYNLVDDETNNILERRKAANNTAHYEGLFPISIMASEEILKIHSLTVKTSLLRDNNVKVDEGCFYEDAEYSIYPLAFANNIYFSGDVVYQYRIGRPGQSVDISKLQHNKDQHLKVMMSLLEFRDAHCTFAPEKLNAIDRAIAYYSQNQYQIFLSIGNTPENKKALKDFDGLLRNNYPSIYKYAEKKSIWLIRKSNYLAFPIGCLAYRAYRTLR